jgi:hypothetical protein
LFLDCFGDAGETKSQGIPEWSPSQTHLHAWSKSQGIPKRHEIRDGRAPMSDCGTRQEQKLEPLVEMNISKGWPSMTDEKRTSTIFSRLPAFLSKYYPSAIAVDIINRLKSKSTTELIETMVPTAFHQFLASMKYPPVMFKYGRKGHGSNIEFVMRIRVRSSDHAAGFVSAPEEILETILHDAWWALSYSRHSFGIVKPGHGDSGLVDLVAFYPVRRYRSTLGNG